MTETQWILVVWVACAPIALVFGRILGAYEGKPSLPMILGQTLVAPVMVTIGAIILAFVLVAGVLMLLFSPAYLFEFFRNRRERPRPPDTDPYYQGVYDGSRGLPLARDDPEYLRGYRGFEVSDEFAPD